MPSSAENNTGRNSLAFDWDVARKRAFHTRSKAIEHLDKHLIDFETHFTRHNGKIIWSSSPQYGRQDLLNQLKGQRVYTYHHPLLTELGLQEESGWVYTDIQKANFDADFTALVFPQFYISENGGFALASYDTQTDRLLALCKKLVLVFGIEQVCPTMNEAENLLVLLGESSETKREFSSVHFSFGNRQFREKTGPTETHALMIDNGRSRILGEVPQRQSLYCIHCGACARASNFSEKPHETVIDCIKAPYVEGDKAFERSFFWPMSGRATAVCPVGIDLKTLMLENRHAAIVKKLDGKGDALAWKAWKTAMLSRKWMNQRSGMKNFTLKSFFKKQWGENREFPKPADRSFNEWWVQERGRGEI